MPNKNLQVCFFQILIFFPAPKSTFADNNKPVKQF